METRTIKLSRDEIEATKRAVEANLRTGNVTVTNEKAAAVLWALAGRDVDYVESW
jgi:hypothetical protein